MLVGNRVKFEALFLNIEGIVSLAQNRFHLTKSYILSTAHGDGTLTSCPIHVLVFMSLATVYQFETVEHLAGHKFC